NSFHRHSSHTIFSSITQSPPRSTLFPYTTLYRSLKDRPVSFPILYDKESKVSKLYDVAGMPSIVIIDRSGKLRTMITMLGMPARSEEHTSELQSLAYLVCRLLLEKKIKKAHIHQR